MFINYFLHFLVTVAHAWTPSDQTLYDHRHFIELEHRMIMQNKSDAVQLLTAQEHDLMGCKALHHGRGGIESMIACMHFIDREKELKIKTTGVQGLIKDISILCRQMVSLPGNAKKMIELKAFSKKRPNPWSQCLDLTWQQVYLTAYANFSAEPVKTLAFVRQAQENLNASAPWTQKTLQLISGKSETK